VQRPPAKGKKTPPPCQAKRGYAPPEVGSLAMKTAKGGGTSVSEKRGSVCRNRKRRCGQGKRGFFVCQKGRRLKKMEPGCGWKKILTNVSRRKNAEPSGKKKGGQAQKEKRCVLHWIVDETRPKRKKEGPLPRLRGKKRPNCARSRRRKGGRSGGENLSTSRETAARKGREGMPEKRGEKGRKGKAPFTFP